MMCKKDKKKNNNNKTQTQILKTSNSFSTNFPIFLRHGVRGRPFFFFSILSFFFPQAMRLIIACFHVYLGYFLNKPPDSHTRSSQPARITEITANSCGCFSGIEECNTDGGDICRREALYSPASLGVLAEISRCISRLFTCFLEISLLDACLYLLMHGLATIQIILLHTVSKLHMLELISPSFLSLSLSITSGIASLCLYFPLPITHFFSVPKGSINYKK